METLPAAQREARGRETRQHRLTHEEKLKQPRRGRSHAGQDRELKPLGHYSGSRGLELFLPKRHYLHFESNYQREF